MRHATEIASISLGFPVRCILDAEDCRIIPQSIAHAVKTDPATAAVQARAALATLFHHPDDLFVAATMRTWAQTYRMPLSQKWPEFDVLMPRIGRFFARHTLPENDAALFDASRQYYPETFEPLR